MSSPASDGVPTTLRWAVWLLLGQAVGFAVLLVVLIIETLTAPAVSGQSAAMVTIFAGLMGVLFGVLGLSLWRLRRWARGPAIVLQLLLLPIAYSMIASGLVWVGLPVMLASAVGAGALLAPATRAALGVR